MNWTELASFALIALLLTISPGPNSFLIIKTVPTSGRMVGFANVFGVVAAFFLHGALSILGISVILMKSATAFTLVKYLGAAYLIWIGVKSLLAAFKGDAAAQSIAPAKRKRALWRAFVEGFFTNALNPKVSMFYLAAFPQFIPAGEMLATSSFLLVFLHAVIAAVWLGAIVVMSSALSSVTGSGRFQTWLKGTTGVVFIGFGLKLASFKPNL